MRKAELNYCLLFQRNILDNVYFDWNLNCSWFLFPSVWYLVIHDLKGRCYQRPLRWASKTSPCICVTGVQGPDAAGGGPEKDRSCLFILNSSCPTGSSRPTAQVLPVQTDPAPPLPPSCSFGLPQSPYHPQASYPQTLLSPVPNPARILTSPRKPRPPPLSTEDRTKPLGSGLPPAGGSFNVGMGVRLENLFPALNMDGSSTLQDSGVCRGLVGGAVGLMVETSAAMTSTSNSLHHVSHPPLHFHLSSSSTPSPSGYYSCPPASSSSPFSSYSSSSCPSTKSGLQSGSSTGGGGFVPMATANSVPVAAVPGNTYYPPQPTSSPSPSSSSASSLDQSSGHAPSVCVCSSCGCRGNCGTYGALPGYAAAGYLQPFSAGPSLFTLGPLLHLSPLIASSTNAGSGATPFSYPMMMPPPLYRHSPVSHDQQQSFAFYQPHGMLGSQKRAAGSLSCYNCGANGHRAEECKQPPMDSAQQGEWKKCFNYKFNKFSDNHFIKWSVYYSLFQCAPSVERDKLVFAHVWIVPWMTHMMFDLNFNSCYETSETVKTHTVTSFSSCHITAAVNMARFSLSFISFLCRGGVCWMRRCSSNIKLS